MADTGSLIKIHYHNNKEILDFVSDVNGNLYYKNAPIYTQVSEDSKNAIVKLPDGIFVNGSYFLTKEQYEVLTEFSYDNAILKFKDHTISWNYSTTQIQLTNKEIWDALNEEFPREEETDITYFYDSNDNTLVTQDNLIFSTKGGSVNDS